MGKILVMTMVFTLGYSPYMEGLCAQPTGGVQGNPVMKAGVSCNIFRIFLHAPCSTLFGIAVNRGCEGKFCDENRVILHLLKDFSCY